MASPELGVWSCALCGELVYSLGPPTRCPACGALPGLLRGPGGELRPLGRELSWPETLQEGGRRAIQQELDTAELYSRVAAAAQHPLLARSFRALQRIESRHATLLCTIFLQKRPAPTLRPDLQGQHDRALLALVRAREDDTIGLYQAQLPGCAGTELEQVYRGLIAVEEDHNALVAQLVAVVGGEAPV